jgi:FkbM family methyltransferase
MVTISGLFKTILVVTRPLNCLPFNGIKTITFRNGWRFNLTFAQFRDIRDNYNSLKKYGLRQVHSDLFEIDFGEFKIEKNLKRIIFICDLMGFVRKKNSKITQMNERLFRVKNEKFELEGTLNLLFPFKEVFSGEYSFGDYKDKVVLDIGGFQGESAVYFWLSGAKKIIIYEPFIENCKLIETNIKLNNVNAEIYQLGMGQENSTMELDFYEEDKSSKRVVKIKNITDIIRESKADIAKIDCEGPEMSLNNVPDEVLRLIPYYIIELHGIEIEKVLKKKFTSAGFKIRKMVKKEANLSVIYLSIK